MIIHSAFDLLAVVTAAAVFYFLPLPQSSVGQPWRLHPAYVSIASLGMIAGALVAGTGNLLLSGFSEIGKSVLGGLAGAILAIEILKRRLGIAGSTGLRFAAPLAAAIAVGRLGCFFAGIEDRTYGNPTDLPWGHDFGDGISCHPVQLTAPRIPHATSAGFYLFVGVYAGQRFLWEFIKPYGTIIGPLNLFHLICLALLVYAWSYGKAELQHA